MGCFSKKSLLFLLVPMLFALSGCGGGGGGETTISEAGPNAGDSSSATAPPAEQQPAGVVKMTWDPATQENGSPSSDVAGYRLRYGTTTGSYATMVDVGSATSCTVSDLQPGTYYFAVTAYDSAGNESGYSNEVTHRIQ